MNYPKFLHRLGVFLVIVFLTGCAVYAATPPPPPPLQPGQPTGSAGTCPEEDVSTQGILRSTDHGATWTSLGNACIRNLGGLIPADPTPLVVDGRIVLYFVNLAALDKGILYNVSSLDGVNFDPPQPAYSHAQGLADPFVLRLPDGSFRLYFPSEPGGMVSAISADSVNFTLEGTGILGNLFGMPGLLLLPDNRIRFFGSDHVESQGIGSLISSDGLNFTSESGWRIPMPADYLYINNPEPIRLMDGSYLMLYQTQDKKHEGRPEWEAEIHLATSTDGFNWTPNPKIIGYGGTSCVVELPDGTLFIYYGTR